MMKHTPTPWRAYDNGHYWQIDTTSAEWTYGQVADVCSSKYMYPMPYGTPPVSHEKANAEFIVRAVNCHDDLLGALQELADVSRSYLAHMDAADIVALDRARAALAKATRPQPDQ